MASDCPGGAVVKMLYIVGVAMLVSAGILGASCGLQWLRDAPHEARIPEPSCSGRSHAQDSLDQGVDQEATSPLMRQAMAFSLHLRPRQSPASDAMTEPSVAAWPVPRPPAVTPKFRLLSTSYYRSCPEKSLALIAEPGKGGQWVIQGDRLGHLVVESINDGGIVCRDGNRLHEMTVAIEDIPPVARLKPGTPAAVRSGASEIRPVNASFLSARGAGASIVQSVAGEELE